LVRCGALSYWLGVAWSGMSGYGWARYGLFDLHDKILVKEFTKAGSATVRSATPWSGVVRFATVSYAAVGRG
jgi:hypothetical protein